MTFQIVIIAAIVTIVNAGIYGEAPAAALSASPVVSAYSSFAAPISAYSAYPAPISAYSTPISAYSTPNSVYSAYSAPISAYSAPAVAAPTAVSRSFISTYTNHVASAPVFAKTIAAPVVSNYAAPVVSSYTTPVVARNFAAPSVASPYYTHSAPLISSYAAQAPLISGYSAPW